jgi:hypothetical protein
MFAVAVLMAVLKLGGASGAGPLCLKTAPAEPVAETTEPAVVRQIPEVPEREARDLRRSAESAPGPIKRLLAGTSGGASGEKVEASTLTG